MAAQTDTWAECELCSKWRNLGPGVQPDELPDKWDCSMNPDALCASCDAPEEPEVGPEEPEELPQGQYEVSMLLKKRRNFRNGRTEYKVRWLGFDHPGDDSWEDESNIHDPRCERPTRPRPACTRIRPVPRHACARVRSDYGV